MKVAVLNIAVSIEAPAEIRPLSISNSATRGQNRPVPTMRYMQSGIELYHIPRPDRGRPWHFKYLTVNRVYFPLARCSGRILELLRANKAKGGDRTKKLFQFLNEIGTIALSRHLGRLQEIAEDSDDKWEYEARVAKRFGFEQQLELPIPIPLPAPPMKEAAS